MWLKNAGTWLPFNLGNLFIKYNGQWKQPKRVYINVGGAWVDRTPLPDNVVVLYDTLEHPGYLCDGTNGTYNLCDALLVPTSTPVSTGGNDVHLGSEHGRLSGLTGWTSLGYGARFAAGLVSSADYLHQNNSHPHNYDVTFTDTVSTLPPQECLLRPSVGGKYIGKDAIIPTINTATAAYLTSALTLLAGSFIRLATGIGLRSNSVLDSHAHQTWATDIRLLSRFNALSWEANSLGKAEHSHQITLSSKAFNHITTSHKAIPYRTTQDIEFGALPSGALIFLTDTNLPDGYVLYTDIVKPFKFSSESWKADGDLTHTHSATTTHGMTQVGATISRGSLNSAAWAYFTASSAESLEHSHSLSIITNAVACIARYVGLYTAVKL